MVRSNDSVSQSDSQVLLVLIDIVQLQNMWVLDELQDGDLTLHLHAHRHTHKRTQRKKRHFKR